MIATERPEKEGGEHKVKVIIKGKPKEIAALVLAAQGRQDSEIIGEASEVLMGEINPQTEPNRFFQ